jgi:hypothetical protein
VCIDNPSLPANHPDCKPPVCIDNPSLPPNDERCNLPQQSKQAVNLTRKLTPEQTVATPAKASDVIEYTLTAANKNEVPKTGFTMKDPIADVLDYAEVDQAFITSQGGVYSPEEKTVSFANQTVPAKGQVTKVFRVQVKTEIPSTNQPNATATEYDCKMQNAYGNEVIVPVDCSVIKAAETLPNTGPGTTIGLAALVAAVSSYFFMRSRLLAKEMTIIKKSHQSGS